MTLLDFTFQEGSPLIAYSGWIEGSAANDPLAGKYNGSFIVTSIQNSTATFSFSGTGVSLFGAKRGNHGNYTVKLDSQPLFTGNGNSPDPGIFQTALYQADNLGLTTHTVTLTNVGASGLFLDLDFVKIQRQIGQDGDTIFQAVLDDASSSVQYIGSWQKTTGMSTAYQGTLSTTTQTTAQAVVTFQGCCVELYGLYGNAPYSVVLDNQPPVTFQGLNFDLAPSNTLLFLADGLSETGTHTVTLSNINSNSGRPLSFDYALIRSTQNISSIESATATSFTSATGTAISSASTDSSNDTPVGPIVGGVIGGLLFVTLLVMGFVFLRRRRRRKDPAFALDLMEEEPKPYVLSSYMESQGGPYHSREPSQDRALPSLPMSAVAPVPSSKGRPQQQYYPRSDMTSEEGLLSPQEQSEALGLSSHGRSGPSSASGSSTTRSRTLTSSSGSTSRRDAKSGFSTPGGGRGEGSEAPAVQEEDAGIVLEPEDEPPPATSLPPAYNPEWHSERP